MTNRTGCGQRGRVFAGSGLCGGTVRARGGDGAGKRGTVWATWVRTEVDWQPAQRRLPVHLSPLGKRRAGWGKREVDPGLAWFRDGR